VRRKRVAGGVGDRRASYEEGKGAPAAGGLRGVGGVCGVGYGVRRERVDLMLGGRV
jgi:hypothetical protein